MSCYAIKPVTWYIRTLTLTVSYCLDNVFSRLDIGGDVVVALLCINQLRFSLSFAGSLGCCAFNSCMWHVSYLVHNAGR